MKRGKGFLVLFGLFLLLSSSVFARIPEKQRIYPFPAVEAEEIAARWFAGAGFEVHKTSSEDGRTRLEARKGEDHWEITIRPASPLASSMLAETVSDGTTATASLDKFWAYLEDYSKNLYSGQVVHRPDIPGAVFSRMDSVVCIIARKKDENVQLSGFHVEQSGLILSTAHNLEGVLDIVVHRNDGRESNGRVVKIDRYRDLALIEPKENSSTRLSLAEGRNTVDDGETIYSIGCPLNHQATVQTGVIRGSQRRVYDLPLWEVEMETLPGSSGSPVLDAQGNLIGVVKGRYRGSDSRGFLIPIATVVDFLEKR